MKRVDPFQSQLPSLGSEISSAMCKDKISSFLKSGKLKCAGQEVLLGKSWVPAINCHRSTWKHTVCPNMSELHCIFFKNLLNLLKFFFLHLITQVRLRCSNAIATYHVLNIHDQ